MPSPLRFAGKLPFKFQLSVLPFKPTSDFYSDEEIEQLEFPMIIKQAKKRKEQIAELSRKEVRLLFVHIFRHGSRMVKHRRTKLFATATMRFLHLIRPVMCVLPEVASPDRKVSFRFLFEFFADGRAARPPGAGGRSARRDVRNRRLFPAGEGREKMSVAAGASATTDRPSDRPAAAIPIARASRASTRSASSIGGNSVRFGRDDLEACETPNGSDRRGGRMEVMDLRPTAHARNLFSNLSETTMNAEGSHYGSHYASSLYSFPADRSPSSLRQDLPPHWEPNENPLGDSEEAYRALMRLMHGGGTDGDDDNDDDDHSRRSFMSIGTTQTGDSSIFWRNALSAVPQSDRILGTVDDADAEDDGVSQKSDQTEKREGGAGRSRNRKSCYGPSDSKGRPFEFSDSRSSSSGSSEGSGTRRKKGSLYVRRCARAMGAFVVMAAISMSTVYLIVEVVFEEEDRESVLKFFMPSGFAGGLLSRRSENPRYRKLPQGGTGALNEMIHDREYDLLDDCLGWLFGDADVNLEAQRQQDHHSPDQRKLPEGIRIDMISPPPPEEQAVFFQENDLGPQERQQNKRARRAHIRKERVQRAKRREERRKRLAAANDRRRTTVWEGKERGVRGDYNNVLS